MTFASGVLRVSTERRRNPAVDAQDRLSISALASHYGLSLRALRFYESRGLIQPERDGQNRLYTPADRARLEVILKGKLLGFTLTEISRMIEDERDDGPALKLEPEQIAAQIDALERQRVEIDRALDELRATHGQIAATEPPSRG